MSHRIGAGDTVIFRGRSKNKRDNEVADVKERLTNNGRRPTVMISFINESPGRERAAFVDECTLVDTSERIRRGKGAYRMDLGL